MDDANPYASPLSQETLEPSPQPQFDRLRFVGAWAIAVAINLPIPCMLGLMIVDGPATGGVAVALIIVALAGIPFSLAPQTVAEATLRGLRLFAVTQLVPIIQMVVGVVAIRTCVVWGIMRENDADMEVELVFGFWGGLTTTLFTWAPLLAMAGLLGLGLNAAFPRSKEIAPEAST